MARTPPGYTVKKVYLIDCERCGEDITRAWSGDDVTTREEADQVIADHQKIHEQDDSYWSQ